MFLSKLKIAVVGLLLICGLGIGVSGVTRVTRAAEPPPPASKSAVSSRDDGNLKETVLALEKRIWEAYTKQDVDIFKNLVADDFVCTDMLSGRRSDKAGVLDYVAKFRILEYTMKDVKVVLLNATSAIVSYEIDYTVRPTNGQEVESTTRRAASAWAQRSGRWWFVYFDEMPVLKQGAAPRLNLLDGESVEDLSVILKKINAEKKPQEKQPKKENPRLKPGAAVDSDKGAKPHESQGAFADADDDNPPPAKNLAESGVQVRLHSDYPFRSRQVGGDDTWEMDARRLLAGRSPKASPWSKDDTWEMNDFWHFSPWGKGDTWRLNKLMEKGGFWSPRAPDV